MASSILEAFVKLFADDSELKKTFGALPGVALKAGADVGQSFTAGVGRGVTPSRATNVSPLQLQRVGGQEVSATGSPFSEGFQQFKTARELAQIQKSGVDAFSKTGDAARKAAKNVNEYDISARDAAGTARALGVSLISELNPALGAGAGLALDVARNLKGLGVAFAAGGAAAALAATAVLLFIGNAKDANKATADLNKAVENNDLAGLEDLIRKSSDALSVFNTNTRIANSQEGLLGFKAGLQAIVAFWSSQFGPGAEKITADMEKQRKAFTEAFKEANQGKPRLQAIIEAQGVLQGQIGLDKEMAKSSGEVRRQSDLLTESLRKQTQAQADLILEEKKQIELDRKKLGDEVTDIKLSRVDEKAQNVLEKGAQEREKIRRADDRSAAEFDAKARERDGKDLEFRRRHTDAAIGLAKAVVDSEFSENRNLEEVLQARGKILEASTKSQLDALKEQSDAQRASIQERMQGATGSELVELERELTEVTQEESAKRIDILAKSAAEAIQLAQRERQERIAQAQQLFSIQRDLGKQTLQDELNRQTAIATATQTGSKVQLAALAQVASQIKAQSEQAKQFLSEAIAASNQLAQRAGMEGPAFVSKAQLARDAATRMRELEDAQSTFNAGGSVRSEDAQALAGGQLEQFRKQQLAGAAALARQSVGSGQSAEGFLSGLTGAGSFQAQIEQGFKTPAELFKSQVGEGITQSLENMTSKAEASFTSLVTAAGPALQSLETLFSETWERINAKADAGISQLGQSLTRMVSDNLSRSFSDAERRS